MNDVIFQVFLTSLKNDFMFTKRYVCDFAFVMFFKVLYLRWKCKGIAI